jgi:hypothetical protein
MTESLSIATVAPIVCKHLPSTNAEIGVAFGDGTRAQFYANEILNADSDGLKHLPVSADEVHLDSLKRALANALDAVFEMQPHTLRNLRSSREEGVDLMTCQADLVEFLVEAHDKVTRFHSYDKKLLRASPKRNYRATAIVRACRNIWGEEHWCIEHGEWGEGDAHYEFVESFAPRSQNLYRPGPFGRFVEDVFEILDVRTSDGGVVSAAAALEALQSLERQCELHNSSVIS